MFFALLVTEHELSYFLLPVSTSYLNSSSCISYAVMMCGRGRGREVDGTDIGSASCDRVVDVASKMIERLPLLFDLRKLRLSSSKVNTICSVLRFPTLSF
jgi:hypothetical protein